MLHSVRSPLVKLLAFLGDHGQLDRVGTWNGVDRRFI